MQINTDQSYTTDHAGSTRNHQHVLLSLIAGLCLLMGGCVSPSPEGAVSGIDGTGTTPEASSGDGAIKVLDLTTGTISDHDETYDISSAPITSIVFRRIPGAAQLLGSDNGSFGAEDDEIQTIQVITDYYLAVTELTQAQWQQLAGSTPWTSTGPSDLLGDSSTVSTKPAYALSHQAVNDALNSFNASNTTASLLLPTSAQWEFACRGATGTSYSWGEAEDLATTAQYAVVRETKAGINGPREVAGRQPNPFGLYDMHGNVWELTSTEADSGEQLVRGGSWNSNLINARSANLQAIEQDLPHACVGARLVLAEVF